ncbi:outer membrane protein assembly factor BamB family protein [Catellatospora vulcania]|uniref:outer membrane protein assembly factor BamB family protein n=1 Tax=Catellatospora vulcania TaxID=1460450 RepID=UPI0018AFC66B|nr:PQQ-binding-like beta-propeller repeat protein [Catellatospora vulcania]
MIFETAWRHSLHQRAFLSRSAVGSGRVVVHERRSRLVGLDVRDGGVRWDVPLGLWPYALTVTAGWCLAIPQWLPWLSCHEAVAGERLWRAELPRFTGHLAVAGSVAVVGGWRGYTPQAGYDLADGSLLWRTDGPVAIERPHAFDDRVLVADQDTGLIRALDPRTGTDLATWRLPEPVLKVDSGPVFLRLDAERVLVRAASGSLWELRPGSGALRRLPGVPDQVRSVTVTGGLIWCNTGDRQVVVLEPGEAVPWARVKQYGWAAGVAAVASGFVIASELGGLTLVNPAGEEVGHATVDKRIGGLHGVDRDRVLVRGKSELLAVDLRP